MMTNYQIKKYGYSLCPSYYTPKITKEDIKRITNNANHRERNRKRKEMINNERNIWYYNRKIRAR